jgi:tRNA(Ile)-lysidine synthase
VRNLVEEIDLGIRRRKLFRRGQPILIAVSGGVDSMVLLQVLYRLAPRYQWRLTIAHLNHRLRGRSSDADEKLVRRAAKKMGLPVMVESADVRATARLGKLSLEMAARKLRHEFLARAAVRTGSNVIALAHHGDDQIELFFLRLLRGSGADGLAGMKWCNPSPENAKIQLARPLLEQPKARLQEFARINKVPFREDASNASLDFQRNRIRNELLPLLKKKYQPALTTVISRLIDITSAEADLAAGIASSWLDSFRSSKRETAPGAQSRKSKAGKSLPTIASKRSSFLFTGPFDSLPVAVQRRCIHSQVVALGVKPHYELLEHLRLEPGIPVCIASVSKTSEVSGGSQTALYRDPQGLLHFQVQNDSSPNNAYQLIDVETGAGQLIFENVRIQWRIDKGRRISKPKPGSEVFDADSVGSPILLRHWRFGDRFRPIGMSGSVKLQDFLTNQKVPRSRRHELILGVDRCGEIFWVENMRISDRFKLTPQTIRRLHWCWQRL